MISFVGHLHVAQSPDEAFELLADMADLDRWNPNVRSAERVSGERLEVGSRYESTLVRGPIRMTAHSQLVAIEAGASVTYEGTIGSFWSVDTLTFQADPAGAKITFRNVTTPPKWLRFVAPAMNAAFQRQARKAIDGADAYLAGSPPSDT